MSKKKKRRSHSAPGGQNRTQGSPLSEETRSGSKRFKPAARNLLFLDLIFLGVSQLLYSKQLLSQMASGLCTLVGLVLLLLALWIQFGRHEGSTGGPSGPPRLK